MDVNYVNHVCVLSYPEGSNRASHGIDRGELVSEAHEIRGPDEALRDDWHM